MLLPRWLDQLAQRWSPRNGKRRRRILAPIRRRVRPRLEVLEDRLTPSSYDTLSFSIAPYGPAPIAPNQPTPAITVQLQDANGNAVKAASNVTVQLSSSSSKGQFLDLSGKALANNSIVIPAGSSDASFEYEDGQAGRATLKGLSISPFAFGGMYMNIQDRLVFTTPPQTVAPGQASQPITIQLQDANGNAVKAASNMTVQLSSSSSTVEFLDTSGNPLPITSTGAGLLTIAAGASSASFAFEDSQAEQNPPSITASINGGESVSQSEKSQDSLAFTTAAQNIAPNQPSGPITIQLQDANGNAVKPTSNVTIQLSSTSSTGKFLDTSGNALANNTITITAGSSTASFKYEDSTEWFPTLTATVSGSTISGNQTENVGNVAFVYSTSAQTIAAGQQSAAITVQLQDGSGKAVVNQSGAAVSVNLRSNSQTGQFLDSSGKALANNSVTIAAGASSASFLYEDSVAGKPTLTASTSLGGSITVSQQETVTGPYALQFIGLTPSIATNQASQLITVQLVDSTGNVINAASAVTVTLSSSSSGGKFLDSSGKALANNSITIAAGASSASFEYEDSAAGLPTIAATENGLSITQQEAVGVKLVITTPAQTLTAGQNSQAVTVQLQDSSGNAFDAPSDLDLTVYGAFSTPGGFLSTSPGVTLLDTAGNPLSASDTITIAKGSNSASFAFNSALGGTLTAAATFERGYFASGSLYLLEAKQQETVNGPSSLVFTTQAQTLAAGQTSGTVTLQLEDKAGKPVNAPTGGLAIYLNPGLSSTAKFFDTNGNLLPTDQNNVATIIMAAGSSTVSFQFQSTQTGYLFLGATAANGLSAGQQTELIQAGSPGVVAFLTGAQSLVGGVPSGSIKVQLQDKYGDALTVGSGDSLTFNLSSSSSTGKFLSVSGDPLANSSITIGPGNASAIFEYEDSQVGTPTLTVTASGVSGTQQETVASISSEIHVTNTNDSGAGSLRAAIDAANNNPGSTIVFDSGVTGAIDLQSELPTIIYNTNILGPGANVLTIDRSSTAATTFGGFTVGFPSTAFAPPEPTVTISGLTVADFDGTNIQNDANLTLRQVDVSNSQALPITFPPNGNAPPQSGIVNEGALTVLDSTIANNGYSGIYGEAAYLPATTFWGNNLTVINSTITGNSGGGITVFSGAYVANSTVSGNTDTFVPDFSLYGLGSVGWAGGITAAAGVTLYDTLVAANTNTANAPPDVIGTFLSLGNNLIGQADSRNSGVFISSDQVGTTTSPIDPKLGALTNNGGPTPTMALLTGSPAIAAGSSVNAPATDQRGDPRPIAVADAIDIGAFEVTTAVTGTAPSITSQPSNATPTVGDNAIFTASASGVPTPTVQWQVSSDGGKTFTDISGATSTTLTLNAVTVALSGNEYQAVFTNIAGSVTSNAATLTVNFAPVVTTNPSNLSVSVGQNATFTAAASANPTATVQWQSSTDGKTWSNLSDGQGVSGSTTGTLTLSNVAVSMNNEQFRAVFNNPLGNVTSNTATLTVSVAAGAPSITGSPSNATVMAGNSATFTASASGNPTPTVQWQVSSDGKTWNNLSDGPGVSGSTTGTLTLSNVANSMNNEQFRAVFTNSTGTTTTNAATLTVTAGVAPVITGNPSNVTVTAGQSASFTASASGTPTPTVQWQVSTDGGATFTNINNATGATLTLNNVSAAMNGNQFHAVFTNAGGTVTSAAVTLTVKAPPPPPAPPVLQPPPLLAFLNSFFGGGTLTVDANGTETVTDSFFGIPLFVSTFDASGKLMDVTFFGIDITFLFLLL